MPEPRLDAPPTWRSHWPALVLGGVAALVALWARHVLFPALSWNRDEPVYLWHMEVLRAGQLTATDGGYPELFRPWLSALGDGNMYSQYTLGWPLALLAAAVLTGSAGNALLIGAALAVTGVYALTFELTRSRRTATLAGALFVASPILAIQGGVYLGYLFTLGLGLHFLALLISGARLGSRLRIVAAGPLVGWIFLTRPYDAVLWAAAGGLYLLWADRVRWKATLGQLVACGAAAAPFVVAALAYNRHVTGELLTFPITAADPLDTFGFGTKRLMPTFNTVEYGPGRALHSVAKNGFVLSWFLVGSYLGLAVAAMGLWWHRRERWVAALVLTGAVFPVGYFAFWGTYLSSLASRISGPIYLVPLYAPICILMALALVRLWDERRNLAIAAAAALAVVTVPVAWSRFDVNRDISVAQEPWRDSLASIETPAIVAVVNTGPYVLYTNPFAQNTPDLDGEVLFAAAGTPELLDLIGDQPDRTPYLQIPSVSSEELGPREDPWDLAVAVVPAEVVRGEQLRLRIDVTAPDGAGVVALTIHHADDQVTMPVTGGRAQHEVTIAPADLDDNGILAVTTGYGDTAAEAVSSPHSRLTMAYRVVDGVIEVLRPALAQTYTQVGSHFEWRHAAAVNDFVTDLRPAP